MLQRIENHYRAAGLRGVADAVLRRLKSAWVRPPSVSPVTCALNTILLQADFTIVQIGAYVGDTPNDPIFPLLNGRPNSPGGRLICVEPVKQHFERLVSSYGGTENVFFENVAISDTAGAARFYRLGVDPTEHGYPETLSQLGSLKADRMGSLWDRYEANAEYKAFYLRHRIEDEVTCIRFSELCRRHDIRSIDLLQMDVEGYEWEILSTIDFDALPVRFVNYESVLLHERRRDTERLMRKWGYLLVDYGQDTFCFRKRDRGLSEAWMGQ